MILVSCVCQAVLSMIDVSILDRRGTSGSIQNSIGESVLFVKNTLSSPPPNFFIRGTGSVRKAMCHVVMKCKYCADTTKARSENHFGF